MGLGSWVRKSGLGLLGWKMGCSYGHSENLPRVGRQVKNHHVFMVDASGWVA